MKRHRPSEAFAPRPGDLIASRVQLIAALVRAARVTFEAEGTTWDHDALSAAAEKQAQIEAELLAVFAAFREVYMRHAELHRLHSSVIARATETLSTKASKNDLRLCRLRRPPLAKVQVAIAEARRRAG
jgi:hypothetical protein